jgi:type I restriction enzyme R subunit
MTATSFWSSDGKPMSATQFVEGLYGELPELFKDEDELRALWCKPDTRKKLLAGLEDKGYGQEQLREISKFIDAEYSDLFDVLAYIAYALPTITREERVESHKKEIFGQYSDKQNEFLSFILEHYIAEGVSELDQEKLPGLLELKYYSVRDAMVELGSVPEIQNVFIGFQEHLYADE